MPSNSEYAQRQFRAQAADRADREIMLRELRELRDKVRTLEEKVAHLSGQLSLCKSAQAKPRGFS